MVVEVFIAQGQAIHPLAEQFQQFMFDQILIPVVLEALGKPLGVAVAPIQPGQEHAAPVPGNVSGLNIDHHGTTASFWKQERLHVTVCRRGGVGSFGPACFYHNK